MPDRTDANPVPSLSETIVRMVAATASPRDGHANSQTGRHDAVPQSEIQLVAHAILVAHPDDAVAVAERAAENLRGIGMTERVAWWERVIAAIKTARPITKA